MQALAEDSGADDNKSASSDSEDSSDSSSFAGVSGAKQEPEVPASANKKQSAKGKAKAAAKKKAGKKGKRKKTMLSVSLPPIRRLLVFCRNSRHMLFGGAWFAQWKLTGV